MARIQYTPNAPGRPHPVAVAHALISPVLRQHQALLGYGRVLHALPKVSIYSPTLELLKTHINNSMIYGSQAINHAVVVLEHMLARKSEGILLPPEPYPILEYSDFAPTRTGHQPGEVIDAHRVWPSEFRSLHPPSPDRRLV